MKKTYRLLFVGDCKTGKTSLIERYTENTFLEKHKNTIGIDCKVKTINQDGIQVKIQMFDFPGDDRSCPLTNSFLNQGSGAFVVVDPTRPETIDSAIKWKEKIDLKVRFMRTDGTIPVLLLVNKIDQINKDSWTEIKEKLGNIVKECNFIGWTSTSAKDNTNIDEVIMTLMSEIYKRDNEDPDPTIINDSVLRKVDSGGKCL